MYKMSKAEFFYNAFQGGLVADALAMPVHWYYTPARIQEDYGAIDCFKAPKNPHPESILWRSSYQALNEKGEILHEQAQYWGQRDVHYHQFLQAGENTLNLQLARELYTHIVTRKAYDREEWSKHYVECMTQPNWHRDTYIEECHRGFFTRYAMGKPLLKCGIKDEHIGGLAQIPALLAALARLAEEEQRPLEREALRQSVREHLVLTHRHSNVIRAADCLTRLLWSLSEGETLGDALMRDAGDWFSTKRAQTWRAQPDTAIIGQKISSACYIDQAFPASLYLAWKYQADFVQGIQANAEVGGDNCHRGVVVGALLSPQTNCGAYFS